MAGRGEAGGLRSEERVKGWTPRCERWGWIGVVSALGCCREYEGGEASSAGSHSRRERSLLTQGLRFLDADAGIPGTAKSSPLSPSFFSWASLVTC